MAAIRRVVQVEVASGAAELAADVLWQADPSAVSLEDMGRGRVRLTADIAEPAPLTGLPDGSIVHELAIDGDAYLDLWRDWATPVRAGRRVVLHPAWLPVPVEAAGDLTILIDPGRAFGSGSHPSTRLVIAVLEEQLRPGHRVLDVGAGSGVLAVAACLLGASAVMAIDVDPAALTATEANARLNAVGQTVSVSATPLAQVVGTFDLVLANIGAGVLRAMADDLVRRTAPGGFIVLAGLLEEQVDDVVACFPGLSEVARPVEGGWAAVLLRKSG